MCDDMIHHWVLYQYGPEHIQERNSLSTYTTPDTTIESWVQFLNNQN